jgi:phosphoglycolate phosphatase-like HAD superfamily hydrolase
MSEPDAAPLGKKGTKSPRWTWRGEPVAGGTAVAFDLDGVLSDATHRQALLRGPHPDWESFFSASGEDPLVEEVATLLRLLSPSVVIVLLTARPARVREVTLDWLARHDIRWDLLVMRRDGDYRPAHQFKRESLRDLLAHGFDLRLCFEDDRRNVEMFRAEGVPALYIHSGYYD